MCQAKTFRSNIKDSRLRDITSRITAGEVKSTTFIKLKLYHYVAQDK